MAGVLTPGDYLSQNQFFLEHFDALFWSLQPNGLAASDLVGLWNEVRIHWP
jgi:hypothetical protein